MKKQRENPEHILQTQRENRAYISEHKKLNIKIRIYKHKEKTQRKYYKSEHANKKHRGNIKKHIEELMKRENHTCRRPD